MHQHVLTSERRLSARFPLELEAELSADNIRIKGTTANISSGGLLMTCDEDIGAVTPVTVRIKWPIRKGENQVILVVHGEIVRHEPTRIAILKRQHEFEVASQAAIEH